MKKKTIITGFCKCGYKINDLEDVFHLIFCKESGLDKTKFASSIPGLNKVSNINQNSNKKNFIEEVKENKNFINENNEKINIAIKKNQIKEKEHEIKITNNTINSKFFIEKTDIVIKKEEEFLKNEKKLFNEKISIEETPEKKTIFNNEPEFSKCIKIENKETNDSFSTIKSDSENEYENKSETQNFSKQNILNKKKTSPFGNIIENTITEFDDIIISVKKNCPKCTLELNSLEIENHDCNYLQCNHCSEYFPNEVVENHKINCVTNNNLETNNNNNFNNKINNTNSNNNRNNTNITNENSFNSNISNNNTNTNSLYNNFNNDTDFNNERIVESFFCELCFQVYPFEFSEIHKKICSKKNNSINNLNNFNIIPDIENEEILVEESFCELCLEIYPSEFSENHKNICKNKIILNKNFGNNINKHLCVICQENVENEQDKVILPCIHFFHPHCINKWKKIEKKCPICKFAIV